MSFNVALVAAVTFAGVVTSHAGTPESVLDVPFVSQSENLCGGASVAMVLRYWGERRVFAEDFSVFLNAEGSGIPTGKLVEAVRGRGALALSFRGDEASARHHLDAGRPIVVLLEAGAGRYHYVVLVGWSDETAVLHDPLWGAFRRFEARAFRDLWSGAGHWALLILPGESRVPPTTSGSGMETRETSSCASLVAEAVALSGKGELASAERRLERCPDDPAALRELAGVHLLKARNAEASAIAERAVTLDPTDGHSWRTLATARFLDGDADGALLAWNHLGEPVIDLTLVSGAERTPPGLLVRQLGLEPKELLRPESLSRARSRLSDFPALSFSAVRYRPLPGGLAEIEVAAVERPLLFEGPLELASRALHTISDRELSLEMNNVVRRGERWSASWRFWEERPRLAVSLEVPRLFGLSGVGRISTEWDRQAYATASGAVTRETMRNVQLALSDRAGGGRRWEITLGGEAWDERGAFLSFGGAVEKRWLDDRLSAQMSAQGFLGAGDSFATGDLEAHWRSSPKAGGLARLLARARLGTTSNGAPRALWQGAGVGHARPTLLRAHPLLVEGVVSGEVFGRHLLSGGLELERFRSAPSLIRVGASVFIDAAKSWRTLSGVEAAHVDVGCGLRLSLAHHGTFRLDVARGLKDGKVAASLGFELGWP